MERAVALGCLLLLSVACTPSPGRPPDLIHETDAGVAEDASFQFDAQTFADASGFNPDALPFDAVAVADGGDPIPNFVFTGIYSIIGGNTSLFARELDGKLDVLIGQMPYNYIGTIDSMGHVDLTSDVLVRGGCDAHLTGAYMRDTAGYTLHHKTCNAQGAVVESDITGGFNTDYDQLWSGTYEVSVTAVMDLAGCLLVPTSTSITFRWALSFVDAGYGMSVFMASDLIDQQSMYLGTFDPSTGQISGSQQYLPVAGDMDVSLVGQIVQVGANGAPQLQGQRDVIDFGRGCTFRIQYAGTRVSRP